MVKTFLIDQQIIQQIVSAIGPKESDNLIEIGPGMAAITEHLVQLCPAMTLVELDRDLVDYLKEKFSHHTAIKQFTVGMLFKLTLASFITTENYVW